MGIKTEDESLMNSIAEENGQIIPNQNDWIAARNQNLVMHFILGVGTNTHHMAYLRHL